MKLKITNIKTGLSKMIDISNYTKQEIEKITKVYIDAGYTLDIKGTSK